MSDERSTPDRRRFGRIVQESLISNLGEVVDLSKGGMRVRINQLRDYESAPIEVTFDGVSLPWKLLAEPIWLRTLESGQHEAGFRFIDVSDAQAAWLAEIGMRFSLDRQFPDVH